MCVLDHCRAGKVHDGVIVAIEQNISAELKQLAYNQPETDGPVDVTESGSEIGIKNWFTKVCFGF